MSENLPDWLTAALADLPARRLHLRRPRPAVGQLWLAVPDTGPRVTLLLVRDSGDGIWQGLLCSSETDMATDSDSVLAPELTGAPYALLVHGDLTVPVLEYRFWRSVGQVDREVVRKVVGRGWDREHGFDLGRGLPICSRRDIRWGFKEDELRRLYTVAATPEEIGLD